MDEGPKTKSLQINKARRLRGLLAQSVYSCDLHLMQPPNPMSRLPEADFLHQLSDVLRQALYMADDEIFVTDNEDP